MKTKTWVILLALCLISSVAAAATVKVITQEAMIRTDKRFFAPALVRAPFGAALEELGREGDWFRVNYQGKEGWIHKSAVQEQKFQLSSLAGGQADEASRDEVALAGKGFNPEVEKAFRDKNPKMRYDLVNQVQAYRVEEQKLQAFIRAGNLREPGGAQ
ncbi:MAG TPA: SH3 domain-containing protein [Thermodesulfobacteriota bacterium]|nr:SH3 domain-containing protein [Thermodesulfobacteriota bacterium]